MARQRLELGLVAKARIGEFYLQKALVNVDRHQRKPQTFDNIQQYLSGCAGVTFPPQLNEQLELQQLNWQLVKHSNGVGPSLLFLGGLERDGAHLTLDHTRSTIEIARSVDFVHGKEKYKPILVRLGGVAGNRVAGLTYDCNSKRLTELNISLSRYEAPLNEGGEDGIRYELANKLTVDLPEPHVLNRSSETPYHTAALITESMVMMAYERDKFIFHNKALVCQVTNSGITLGRPTSLQDFDSLKKAGEKLGYYARRESGMVVVGRSKPQHYFIDRDPWKISFPDKLNEARTKSIC